MKTSSYIKTPTVYCDGSTEFSAVNKGSYMVDISIQLTAMVIMLLITLRYSLLFKKKKTKFLSCRFDLFSFSFIEKIVKMKYFSFFIRLIPALLFLLVLATGFWGRAKLSFAAPFVWMFWWTLLIFFVAFAGKIFCAICPWDFFANLYQYGAVFKKEKVAESQLKKWPKNLKNIYLASFFFIVLTWLELGIELTTNSYLTAILGLIIVMVAIALPIFFEKRAFCRYLCPVGRISGIYAIFSPIELRVKSPKTCLSCTTKECVTGNSFSSSCPMELVPFKLKENTYCTLCTECIRSCEKDNLTLKIRTFGSEINDIKPQMKRDEGALALIIFGLTFFHAITMVNPWFLLIDKIRNWLQIDYVFAFSLLMMTFLIMAYLSYLILNRLIQFMTKGQNSLLNLSLAFIPITLAYHLGHNVMHVLGEIPYLAPVLNDPFGWGWNLFNLRDYKAVPLLKHENMTEFQYILMLIGFYYSIKTLRVKLESFRDNSEDGVFNFHFAYFIASGLILFITLYSFWLIEQPMVVRGGII